jgi:hypothetical protein
MACGIVGSDDKGKVVLSPLERRHHPAEASFQAIKLCHAE